MKSFWMACMAGAMLAGAVVAQDAPPADETDPQQTYEAFVEQIQRQSRRFAPQMQRQYQLSEEQTRRVAEHLQRQVDDFLEQQGQAAFELQQKAQALARYMGQSGLRMEELDPQVLQELAEEALPLLDGFERRAEAFADDLSDELDAAQRLKLMQERLKVRTGLAMARREVRKMAGLPQLEESQGADVEASPGQPGPGGGRGVGPAGVGGGGDRRHAWERYVDEFCRRHAFDEVQKLRAQDVLQRYLARLRQVQAATTQPAGGSDGATQPVASAGRQFERRLQQQEAARELFQQMVEELRALATPAQRRLGAEREPEAASSEPAQPQAGPEQRRRP